MKKLRINFEHIFLIAFIALFLYYGCSDLFDNRLKHENPYGYFASDAFLHQSHAEGIKYLGNYRYSPFYKVGGFKDVVAFDPPLLNHLSAMFSYLTGLETYDTIFFIVFLAALSSVLVLYIIIKRFNKNIAILSLPLTILIFTNKFYSGFTWGKWDFYLGFLFFISAIWCLSNVDLKNIALIIGLFWSASFLTHPPEAIFLLGFVLLYLAVIFLFRSLDKDLIKKLAIGGILALIMSFYFIPIFINVWIPTREGNLGLSANLPTQQAYGYPVVSIYDFGWILAIIGMGFAISLILLRKEKKIAPLTAIYGYMTGLSIYIGFDKALQMRLVWPILLSFAFGAALFYTLNRIVKRWNVNYSMILAIILIIVMSQAYSQKTDNPGIVNSYNWQPLVWIEENADKDSKILFLYTDSYMQTALLYSTKHLSWIVDIDDYKEALENKTIKRAYKARLADHGIMSRYTARKSFWSFESHLDDEALKRRSQFSLCEADYYVIDLLPQYSSRPDLIQYNLIIRDQLLKKDAMKEVFNNQLMSILKNSNPGADCIAE